MSGRSDHDGVSVTERQRGYSGSSSGPADDTAVHSRETPMPVEWTLSDPTRPASPLKPDLPDLRKSLRSADDVERDRVRVMPIWLPLVAAAVFLLVAVVGAVVLVVRLTQTNASPPAAERPPIEDIEGVPVRKGLNSN